MNTNVPLLNASADGRASREMCKAVADALAAAEHSLLTFKKNTFEDYAVAYANVQLLRGMAEAVNRIHDRHFKV